MFRSEKDVREPLLMEIAELERYIAQLDGAICANPEKPVALAGYLHLRALEKPVGDRPQRH
jgi:hypothetical protein